MKILDNCPGDTCSIESDGWASARSGSCLALFSPGTLLLQLQDLIIHNSNLRQLASYEIAGIPPKSLQRSISKARNHFLTTQQKSIIIRKTFIKDFVKDLIEWVLTSPIL
jgi:hypothetical protein